MNYNATAFCLLMTFSASAYSDQRAVELCQEELTAQIRKVEEKQRVRSTQALSDERSRLFKLRAECKKKLKDPPKK